MDDQETGGEDEREEKEAEKSKGKARRVAARTLVWIQLAAVSADLVGSVVEAFRAITS